MPWPTFAYMANGVAISLPERLSQPRVEPMPNLTLRRLVAQAKDAFAIARAAGAIGAFNLLKLQVSYAISRRVKRPLIWGRPFAASLEPTTSCNLRCPECLSGLRGFTRPRGMLQEGMATRVLDQLRPAAFYLNLYFQGEPYLNPDFFALVRAARSRGFYVATSTNGHFLTRESAAETVASGLSRLIVSLDGTTQETYQAYRVGGKLSNVLEGLRNLAAARKDAGGKGPYLILQFLVVGPNEHQIGEARRLADELGVDEIRFKTAQIDDYENGHPLIPQDPSYSRYRRRPDGTYRLAHRLSDSCWRMWSSLVVTWDGKVAPCCFDKDAKHSVGSLASKTLKEVWHAPAYNAFRKGILRDRQSIDICRNCTEGGKVFEG